MILFGKELPDLPGIDPELDPEEGKEYPISINLKVDEAKALEKIFNVLVNPLINDAIISETFMSLSKHVAAKSFAPGKDDIKELDGVEELVKELASCKGFAIVNVQIATALQFSSQFSSSPLQKSLSTHIGLYQVGVILNCRIFADPMMLWGDTRVCAVSNNFYNFAEGDSELSLVPDVIFPRTIVKYKFHSKEAESKVFKVNNIQI